MSKPFVAVIPLRSGSKRLVGKNTKLFNKKPLFEWTIEAALNADLFSEIILTSDDEAAMEMVRQKYSHRVTVHSRKPELATDSAPMSSVVFEATSNFSGPATVVLLQVTSPLRTSVHIKAASASYTVAGAKSLISVTPIKGNVSWLLEADGETFELQRFLESHKSSEEMRLFLPNGAIYIVDLDSFHSTQDFVIPKCIYYEMPSEYSVDIDDLIDFEIAEFLQQKYHKA